MLVRICAGQAHKSLKVAVGGFRRELEASARLASQGLPIRNGHAFESLGEYAALLHVFQDAADRVLVDSHLCGKKIGRKGEDHQACSMTMRQQPPRDALISRGETGYIRRK